MPERTLAVVRKPAIYNRLVNEDAYRDRAKANRSYNMQQAAASCKFTILTRGTCVYSLRIHDCDVSRNERHGIMKAIYTCREEAASEMASRRFLYRRKISRQGVLDIV